jgi:aminoglycoside 6'-N-acetyltransferase I
VGNRYGLEIRAATGADAAGLAALLEEAGRRVDPHRLAERIDALRQEGGGALIAVAWGPPSGLVAFHRYRTLDADLPLARIDALLVGPEERRRGIGRLLVKAASQAARVAGCGALQIDVGLNRADLRAFCEATGFTPAASAFERPLRKRS